MPNRNGVWQYWNPPDSSVVELGTVCGLEVALPPHFHEEDQTTFVVSGSRRFVIGDELADVGPGHGAHIPAGTPHRSESSPAGVFCINVYTAPGAYAADELIAGLSRLWRRGDRIDRHNLAAFIEEYRYPTTTTTNPGIGKAQVYGEAWKTVRHAAQVTGMSREGFTRRFKKRNGVPPHTFWMIERLNRARKLLRSGEPIATVAAVAGFSDQSHLSRCFRRIFGITPGRYQAGPPESHLF